MQVTRVMSMLILAGAAAQEASSAVATFNLYNPDRIGWDLQVGVYACRGATRRERLVMTRWLGCVQVTYEHGDGGACATARVVDLDVAVFRQIDTDSVGMAQLVVDCQD
uniref:Barwin domain-containing protein n=1 Tax=Leersia perrieri TaxID=77586 RepID=A0A0D9XTR1_9ORYZ